jgi:hypothetical protein
MPRVPCPTPGRITATACWRNIFEGWDDDTVAGKWRMSVRAGLKTKNNKLDSANEPLYAFLSVCGKP